MSSSGSQQSCTLDLLGGKDVTVAAQAYGGTLIVWMEAWMSLCDIQRDVSWDV